MVGRILIAQAHCLAHVTVRFSSCSDLGFVVVVRRAIVIQSIDRLDKIRQRNK